YRLAAEVMGRSGAVAVAALVLLPVTALGLRRRWAGFALGGGLLVLALMEVPWLFVHLSDAVSLSQSRRAAGFAPLPFALAGATALVARRVAVLPFALAAGIVLQLLWPGDFAYGLRHGAPAPAAARAARPRRRRGRALRPADRGARLQPVERAHAERPAGPRPASRARAAHAGARGVGRDRARAGELPGRRRRAAL